MFFKTEEIVFREEVFRCAVQAVTQALEKITGESFSLRGYVLGGLRGWGLRWQQFYQDQAPGHWVTTRLRGPLPGLSFLWMAQPDAQLLWQAAGSTQTPSPENPIQLFIMELDNILSASFIRILAEAYELELYGDVPEYAAQCPALLAEGPSDNRQGLWIFSEWECQALQIRLEYTWYFYPTSA
ncbi:MAG: hypothetical protein HC913_10795 [Microscillaceae bacterium]|nr:hypothetical protein [Microscillaceae bacterium]